MRKLLLILVFCGMINGEGNWWGDTFWGMVNGVSENHLGKILVQVRDELENG